jgi:hypothetical protein
MYSLHLIVGYGFVVAPDTIPGEIEGFIGLCAR